MIKKNIKYLEIFKINCTHYVQYLDSLYNEHK